METKQAQYSVLMCIYKKDNPQWLAVAIDSMLRQTLPPAEYVIVEDGPITQELHAVITGFAERNPDIFRVIKLSENVGLGRALRAGVPCCANEWIVRMDADDYSAPKRIEKQLEAASRMNADIVGCDVAEFIGVPNEEHCTAFRVFPENHEEIIRFGRRRTPFAHPAVLMRKSCVLNAGNYQDAYLHEDYDLFVRMLQGGCVAYTVKEPLVYMRISRDFYKRRGGAYYLRALLKFNCKQLKNGWMRLPDFLLRSASNIVFCLVPNGVRDYLYRRILRK